MPSVELGAADVVLRVQQRHLVLGHLHRRLRVGLDDVLLGELEVESRLLQVEFLFRAVEFDDDVAFVHGRARLGELHDLQLAAHRRHGELGAPRRAKIPGRVDRNLHLAAQHSDRRDRARLSGRHAARDGKARDNEDETDGRRGSLRHFAAPSAAGSLSETRSPSRTPAAIAVCSRPRRSTVIGRLSVALPWTM